jgi:hypothetical protein
MVQGSKFLRPISSPVYECPSEDGIEDGPGPQVSLTDQFLSVGVSKRGRAEDVPGLQSFSH